MRKAIIAFADSSTTNLQAHSMAIAVFIAAILHAQTSLLAEALIIPERAWLTL